MALMKGEMGMKRKALAFLILVAFVAPAATTSTIADEPVLKLKAPRSTFMRPRMPNERRRPEVTIRVSAEIEDLEKVAPEEIENYYCLEEVWEWDDDTESEYAPDCDPYEEAADGKEASELKTYFSASHQFRMPGSYNIWLRLQRNGKTMLAGNVRIQIRS